MKKASLVWIAICAGLLVLIAYTALSQAQQKPPEPKNVSTSEESLIAGLFPQWKSKNGLAAFLTCERDKFKVGELIPVVYGVINMRDEAMTLQPPHPVVRLCGLDPVSWFSGTGPHGNDFFYDGGVVCGPNLSYHFDAEHAFRLAPGELHGRLGIIALGRKSRTAGTYCIKWNYLVPAGSGSWWQGHLVSNQIRIEIVK